MTISGFYKKKGKTRPITQRKGITSDLQKIERKSSVKKSKFVKPNEIDVKTLKDKLVIKEGLRVDDQTDIMQAMFSVWAKTPEDIKKAVKEIRIYEMERGSDTVGQYDNVKDILYIYMASNYSKDEYEDTFSHELAHSYFKNAFFGKDRNKITKYADEMELLPPITFYSKRFYDDYVQLQNQLDNSPDSKRISSEMGSAAYNYVNEEHSETAMYENARNKNRFALGVISKPVMEQAVKNYDRLHEK